MRKKEKYKKIALIIIAIILIFFVGKAIVKFANISPFLFELLFKKEISLKKSDDNVNVLLLGIGGKNHDGPNLTDTIILASLDSKKNQVNLTSIPRDLWVPDLESANKKINSAYSDGQEKRLGGGLVLAKAIVGKVVGQPVDYGIRIDFSGFEKAVDLVGGLDINVDRTFDDYGYPDEGKEDDLCDHTEADVKDFTATASAENDIEAFFPCRYKHLHFTKGANHMNGITALQFVRSRHAQGIEGSDFARSKRQEKIIKAFKDKIFSLQTLSNPGKVISLYDVLKDSIDTDIKQTEFDDFIRLLQKMKAAQIKSVVIDAGDESMKRPGLLKLAPISKEFGFLSVLIPRIGSGNFLEIQKYVECELKNGNCVISPTPTIK